MKDLRELDQYRDRIAEARRLGAPDDRHEPWAGFFRIPVKSSKRPLTVVASRGGHPQTMGWDHASVSLPGRCPTWEEMDLVKRLFFAPDEVAMQLHVAEAENISNHAYCLHIWRPVDQDLPLPPSAMVGSQAFGELVR